MIAEDGQHCSTEAGPPIAPIVTTNLDYDAWYGFLGQKEMVGALLDRLRHHCVTLRIDGPSLRTPDV